MVLADANVLLYAVNTNMPQHASTKRWIEEALSGNEAVGFAWIVLLAFLRLAALPALLLTPAVAVPQRLALHRVGMASIPAAHNSSDFVPGTTKLQQAYDFILELWTHRPPIVSTYARPVTHEWPYTWSWLPTLRRTATSPSHSNTTRASYPK